MVDNQENFGMLGSLFDDDYAAPAPNCNSQSSYARGVQLPEKKDISEFPFAVPLLQRNISLSKNTKHALLARKTQLELDLCDAEAEATRNIKAYEAAIQREKVVLEEKKQLLQTEKDEVMKALTKLEQEKKLTSTPQGAHSKCKGCGSRKEQSILDIPRSALSDEDSATGLYDETGCGVCIEKDRDALIAPCGHVALCFDCATTLKKSRNPECPYCRVRIQNVYKLFIV